MGGPSITHHFAPIAHCRQKRSNKKRSNFLLEKFGLQTSFCLSGSSSGLKGLLAPRSSHESSCSSSIGPQDGCCSTSLWPSCSGTLSSRPFLPRLGSAHGATGTPQSYSLCLEPGLSTKRMKSP